MLRRRIGIQGATGFKEMSMSECYATAYYLYVFSDVLYQQDGSQLTCPQVVLFFKLLDKMGRRSILRDFLNLSMEEFEQSQELHRLPDETDETEGKPRRRLTHFAGTDIKYEYEEDTMLDGTLSRHPIKMDRDIINLYRFFQVQSEMAFTLFIANFLLRKTPKTYLAPLSQIPAHIQKAANDFSVLKFLVESLKLSDEDVKYLLFQYRMHSVPHLRGMYDDLNIDSKNEARRIVIGITRRDYLRLIKKSGPLNSYGFINEEGMLENDLVECIVNQNIDILFCDLVKEVDCKDAYPLSSYCVNKNATTIMQKMMEGKENISLLLYGKPGSGKTEYAKSLAKATGLKALIFKNEAELEKTARGSGNVISRLNLLLSIARSDTVFIVDEADTLLRTKSTDFFGMSIPSAIKGTVNKMLEDSKNKIIWIVNFTSQIDVSTLRRFNFSYRFESMSKDQLRSITNTKLNSLSLEKKMNKEILGLMEKYNVTGASVDNIVKTIKSLGETDSENLINCIQAILKENQQLINGKQKMRDKVSSSYDIKGLNASMDPEEIVEMIQNARDFAEKNKTTENGIRMLFYGVSGTGKTEFARYISEKLGKKIILKRASDILDKYVGGTEQNIKNAFEEADRTDSILLLDEADTFFASRENAQYSWERSQVNEILTQMEEFSGILICTTNLKKIMDSAMNRRFHMIVEFKPLEKDGLKCMIEKYFSAYDFTDDQLERLSACDSVTPGDFGVLSNRMRFMAPDKLNSEYITEELFKIQEEKKGGKKHRHIGFCA